MTPQDHAEIQAIVTTPIAATEHHLAAAIAAAAEKRVLYLETRRPPQYPSA